MQRPLSRYAIRTALLLGGSRWAHRQDWWPGLGIEAPDGHGSGKVTYKGKQVCSLHPLSEVGHAEEITIIGSGPSIQEQSFASIPVGSAMLLNGAIHLLDGRISEPLAILIEDERFIWRHSSLVFKMVVPRTRCIFSTSVLRAICEINPGWLADRHICHADYVQKPYGLPARSLSDLEKLDFLRWNTTKTAAISLDPSKGFFAGGSVAVTALQYGLSLNPGRLGVAGIDLSNANQPRFYESAGQSAKSGIVRAQDRIVSAFHLAFSVCVERSLEMVNYSPVSALSAIGIPYDARLSVPSNRPGGFDQ